MKELFHPCWCGAGRGQRCRDRSGRRGPSHSTRGEVSRLQMDTVLRIGGFEPIMTDEEYEAALEEVRRR